MTVSTSTTPSQTSLPTLGKHYEPAAIESKWTEAWEAMGAYAPEATRDVAHQTNTPFSIVIPPPNVTGVLHMGHALDNTLQDILTRWHRMRGDTTLWMPGTDHAGIATQNVVERQVVAEGGTREGLGREKFVERTWEWANQCETNITGQLRRLGVSPDWSRQRFTLDEGCSEAVREAFVSLYNEGLIYRGEYIVNWDPATQSAISDIEVEYADEDSYLWQIKFPVDGCDEHLVVATTRPETLYGDVAVAVHPEDSRYKHLVGQQVRHPLTNRLIPIIGDDYVDREFGTGCLKITPAHDPNDFVIGQRHGLESLKVLDERGHILPLEFVPQAVQGVERFEARDITEGLLNEAGLLVGKQEHSHRVGRAQRSGAVVEPLLSMQWFVKTKPLAEACLKALDAGEIRFIPERWTKDYLRWMTNIQDWCISRQLWWGHRIPAWYCGDCNKLTVSKADPSQCGNCGSSHIQQDADVLDTWFSSGLWPFSTMGWPNTNAEDFNTFYPTSVLVTGFDIIFFWVARMTMFGHKLTGQSPFNTVYIHGLIRDEHGQKMSKSKGNTVDPVESIEKYGCDGFRWSLTSLVTYGGQDIKLAPGVLEQGRLFTNKLWNASRFVLMNLSDENGTPVDNLPIDLDALTIMDRWILSRYNHTVGEANKLLDEFKFGEMASLGYEFIWNEFCDWYVEAAKQPLRDEATRANTQRVLLHVLEGSLRLMHPIMPFMTEEIWQALPGNKATASISLAAYPQTVPALVNDELEKQVDFLLAVIRALRNIRQQYTVPPKQAIDVTIEAGDNIERSALTTYGQHVIRLFLPVNQLTIVEALESPPLQSAINVVKQSKVIVPLAGLLDLDKERARLEKKLADLTKEQDKLYKMMGNHDFLQRAPQAVVDKNKAILSEINQQAAVLKEQLANLG
jgi:valyl-tRNA synthetase